MVLGLKVTTDFVEKKTILRVEGRLDVASSPVLEKTMDSLIEKNHANFILDFSKVEYLSSAGMRLLLSETKKLKTKKGKVVLFGVKDEIMEIIRMAGFEKILEVYDIEQEALNSF